MCDASHIGFLCQFRSTRIELEARANAFKDVALTEQTLRFKLPSNLQLRGPTRAQWKSSASGDELV
jgi:hypothetical protein